MGPNNLVGTLISKNYLGYFAPFSMHIGMLWLIHNGNDELLITNEISQIEKFKGLKWNVLFAVTPMVQ